jgi:hypothetical protein
MKYEHSATHSDRIPDISDSPLELYRVRWLHKCVVGGYHLFTMRTTLMGLVQKSSLSEASPRSDKVTTLTIDISGRSVWCRVHNEFQSPGGWYYSQCSVRVRSLKNLRRREMGTGNLVDRGVFVWNRGEQIWKKLRDGKDCWTGHCHFHCCRTLQCSRYRLSHFVCPHLMRHSWGISMIIRFLFASLIYVTRFDQYHSHIQPLVSGGANLSPWRGAYQAYGWGMMESMCIHIYGTRAPCSHRDQSLEANRTICTITCLPLQNSVTTSTYSFDQ